MRFRILLVSVLAPCGIPSLPPGEGGLAERYRGDAGIERDPAVVFFDGFELGTSRLVNKGRQIVSIPELALSGRCCLEVHHTKGTHEPLDVEVPLPPADLYYLRFHVRFEEGFDWGAGHKGPGFYARSGRTSGAGVRPTGTDKFSGRVCFHPGGRPHFYYYHPEQKGPYGDEPGQNVGAPAALVPGRWYSLEIMLRANEVGRRNGEIKMWIDGELKGHYQGIRFRDAAGLRINSFNTSAYFGGTWTAPRDQKRWEDNYVVATRYIGPLRR